MIAATQPTKMTPEQVERFLVLVGSIMERPKTRPAFKEWSEEFAGETGKNFLKHQSPDGAPWKPLKNKRPPSRNSRWPHPLIDSGALMQSLIASGTKGHIERYQEDQLEYGTQLKYAGYHQRGTGKIPKREFLGISPEMAQLAEDLISEEVSSKIDILRRAIGS